MNRAWVFGDDIDTDVLAPGQYMKHGIDEIAKHCLEAVDPRLPWEVRPGDVVVAGRNFGAGSSREQAAGALKQLGVAAVIAPSFAGIFYRNALNLGLTAVVCADAQRIEAGDRIAVDAEAGRIDNRTRGETLACEPIPGHLMAMVRDGGLLAHLREAAGTAMNLRERLRESRIVVAAGVYDALSAALAERAGFEALYLSGASIAYTRLGRPDIGLTTASEVENVLGNIRARTPLPVIVDADTGFGNALNVQRTVSMLERAAGPGTLAIQLEDQTSPKRCGHLDGKSLVSAAEMCGKLRAAVDARVSRDTLVVARTDAVAVEGLEPALERAERYVEAGADVLFVEAVRSDADMRATVERLGSRVPLLVNMVEGGKTPLQPAATLEALGFSVVIFPGGAVRALVHTLTDYYATLARHGTTEPFRDRMLDFDGLQRALGTAELLERGKRYGDD